MTASTTESAWAVPATLGLRLVVGQRRRGSLRLILLVAGTAFGVALLLVALAFPVVQQRRSDRAADRLALCAEPAGSSTHTCGLLGTAVIDTWRGRPLDRQLVSDPAAPAPPGLHRVPRAGEVVLSPSLLKLYRDPGNELLRSRLPGTVIGTIGKEGLLQPDELLAYIGTSAQVGPAEHVVGYDIGLTVSPRDQSDLTNTDPAVRRKALFAAAVLVLLLLAPIILFLASCSRLGAQSRERRLRALRLLGFSPSQVQAVQAVETATSTVLGALLGTGLFELGRRSLTFSLGPYQWFPEDAEPPLAEILALVALMPIAAVLINSAATRRVTGVLISARTRARTRPLSWTRVTPLVLGVILLAYLAVAPSPTPGERNQNLLLVTIIGMVLLLAGIALATPLITQLLAVGMAARGRRLPTLLAGRRLQAEPSGAARVAASLVLLIFISIFGQTVLSGIRAQVNHDVFSATVVPDVFTSSYLSNPADTSALDGIPGIRRVISLITVQAPAGTAPAPTSGAGGIVSAPPPSYSAQVLSCQDLDALFLQEPTGCTDQINYLGSAGTGQQSPSDMLTFATSVGTGSTAGTTFTISAPASRSDVVVFPDSRVLGTGGPIYGTYIIPPNLVPASARKARQFLVITNGSAIALERLQAAGTKLDPLLTFTSVTTKEDEYNLSVYDPLITWGSVIMIIVALAAIAVSALDRAREGSHSVAMQAAVGTPTRTLQVAQILQVLVPYAVGTVLAVLLSLLASRGYERAGGFALTIPAATVSITGAIAVIGALVIGVSCLPAVGTRTWRQAVRRQ